MADSHAIQRCREAGDSCARLGARLASMRHMESSSRRRSEDEGESEVWWLAELETKRSITRLRSTSELMSEMMSLEGMGGSVDAGWCGSEGGGMALCAWNGETRG